LVSLQGVAHINYILYVEKPTINCKKQLEN